MKLILWKTEHKFISYPKTIDVTLAIESNDFTGTEQAQITVSIEASDIKELTLAKIESLAIERATKLLAQ